MKKDGSGFCILLFSHFVIMIMLLSELNIRTMKESSVCTLWFVNDNYKKQHNSLNRLRKQKSFDLSTTKDTQVQ